MSRMIPPPSPVATASTRTPKRSICFLTARIPPLRPKAKVPIRLSARLRSSSIPRRQGAHVVFLHNCERSLDRPNRWVTPKASLYTLICFEVASTRMKEYDLIVIGSGSAMNIVEPMIQDNPNIRIAVIDKDEPGGICLTRGCIPSKILLYPAELVRKIEEARELGIDTQIKKISFEFVMDRMRKLIYKDIDQIRESLSTSENIDYYHAPAEFTAPYTLKVAGTEMRSKLIFLCIGSEATIPSIIGLDKIHYHTSDTILKLTELPESMIIVGAGYIAAEFGHFLSSMGCKVTIIGRNPYFVPEEEPEVSNLLKKVLGRHISIITNHEVKEVRENAGLKEVLAVERTTGKRMTVTAREILIATGRGPTTKILHPERSGVNVTQEGWLAVNDYLETSQPGIWAIGDADGQYLFKHVANYESTVVYNNAVLKQNVKVDYHF